MATQSLINDLEEWKIVDESLGMDLPDNDEPDMYQPPIPPPPPSSPPIPSKYLLTYIYKLIISLYLLIKGSMALINIIIVSELVASIEAQAERAGAAARQH